MEIEGFTLGTEVPTKRKFLIKVKVNPDELILEDTENYRFRYAYQLVHKAIVLSFRFINGDGEVEEVNEGIFRVSSLWAKRYKIGSVIEMREHVNRIPVIIDEEAARGYFMKKIQNGTLRSWDYEGILHKSQEFRNGRLDGLTIYYYPHIERPRLQRTYSKGRMTGEELKFDEEGNVLERKFYKNLLQDGPFEIYDPITKKLIHEGSYKDGVFDGWIRWFDRFGHLTSEMFYRKGEHIPSQLPERILKSMTGQ